MAKNMPSWKVDYDAVRRRESHNALIKGLTADLPINSKVSIAIVDDPLSNNGGKIPVVRSVRNDPLADMLARGIIDQALYLAGRKWQDLYDRSIVGSVGAIDPTKEAVDGGIMRDPISDSQMRASDEFVKANLMLGKGGRDLMMDLLGKHMTVGQMGEKYGCNTARLMNFLSLRVRECLTDLAKMFGFVG